MAERFPPILRLGDALNRMISVSYNWENNLSRPIEPWRVIAPVFRTTGASMGWLVGPQGFEPWTNGL